MKLDTCAFDMVVSQYLLKEAKGKVLLSGYLRSDMLKDTPKGHLYTYLMCTDMSPVTEDLKESVVCIVGKIAKCGRLITQANGNQLMTLVIRSRSDDGHTSILHAIVRDKLARYISSLDDLTGQPIQLEGSLQAKHASVEVVANKLKINGKEAMANA